MPLLIDTSAKMEGRNILKNGYDALVELCCCWMGAALMSDNPSGNRPCYVLLNRQGTPHPKLRC